MTHTKGPWIIERQDIDPYYAYISGGDWSELARVVVRMEDCDEDCADGVANARLIAAAPTMRAYIEKQAAAGDVEAVQILEAIDARA